MTVLEPLSTRSLLRQSWHLITTTKRAVFIQLLAMLVVWVFMLTAIEDLHAMFAPAHPLLKSALVLVLLLLQQCIMAPLLAGLLMLGIRRARGESVRWYSGLVYWRHWPSLGGALILITLINFGLFFCVSLEVALIHTALHLTAGPLTFALTFALPLLIQLLFWFTLPIIIEQQRNPFKALARSTMIIARHYPWALWAVVLSIVLNIAGCLVVLIGLLWTMPMTYILWGLLYRYWTESAPTATANDSAPQA